MPEHRSPGVYVEEIPSGVRVIERLATDVAGFVGLAETGPAAPQRLSGWQEFRETYGGHLDDSYLARAVEGFFLNGGRRCWIARAVPARGRPRVADFLGDPAAPAGSRAGLAALAEIDEIARPTAWVTRLWTIASPMPVPPVLPRPPLAVSLVSSSPPPGSP